MGVPIDVRLMLYLAAALQVIAAGVALLIIPVSGRRVSWIILCLALGLQAWRRLYAVGSNATVVEASTALGVSILLLAGVIGIRGVFVSLRRASRQLERERDRSGTFLNRVGAAIVSLDVSGRVLDANAATCEILGLPVEDVMGKPWFDSFVSEDAREQVHASFQRLVDDPDGSDEYVEYGLRSSDGEERRVVWHRRVLRDAEGRTCGVRSAGIDLTERVRLEQELEFRSLLLDQTTDAVLVYRYDGTIVYANDTACRHRGCELEGLTGINMRTLIPPADLETFDMHLQTLRQGEPAVFETEAVCPEGILRPIEAHLAPVRVGATEYVVDVSRDITERRAAESTVRRLAYSDHLTGLPNRALLTDRAAMAFARARRLDEQLALVFVDFDDLKAVNDTLGHAAGDEIIKVVGERLTAASRAEDTVARIGGDEFVILARIGAEEDADELATRLIADLSQPYEVSGRRVHASASVGVAIYPEQGESLDTLMSHADTAMYAAKGERPRTFGIGRRINRNRDSAG
ncbi:MAG: hypothetical protein CVT59_03585 [Actinobacteria bacterium HGW-Actinobacteria-1]|jgi:diguanylate cyclase (GGDEF)-like protein/PAS domain S-box-containing protein|nr:MAG: hypothetical protein CVT59_03585 [Actinobacteria bacterium HGW-Actinobacteria-1]